MRDRNKGALITEPLSETEKLQLMDKAGTSAEKYLDSYISAFLKKNRIGAYLFPGAFRRRLITAALFALILLLDILELCFLHRHFFLNVLIPLAAAIVALLTLRNSTMKKELRKEIVRRPDTDLDNILASQVSGAKNGKICRILCLVIVLIPLILGAVFMIKPHEIYERNDNGGYTLRYYTLSFTDTYSVILPDSHNGLPVNEIRGNVFSRLNLLSIRLPRGITEIRGNTFENCANLREIVIPDGVTRIGGNAFRGCSKLLGVKVPETVREIGGGAFQGCSSLGSITLPEGITEIRGNTFENCKKLTKIVIPEGVTRIGGHAFYGCFRLSDVTVPASVKEIGSSAFRACSSLRSISIPQGCSVDERAFKESPTKVTRY